MKSKGQKTISGNQLLAAVEQGLISAEQAEQLWNFLAKDQPSSRGLQFLYYFGALLVISAMTWWMTLGWNRFGGGGIFFIALCYGVVFFTAGHLLWKKYRIPGGLLVTAAVCMAPLAIFGVEKYSGWWLSGDPGDYTDYYTWIRGSWVFMEAGTILAGLMALRYVCFPFLTAPIAASLWFLSMDVTPLFFGELQFSEGEKCWVTLVFGLIVLFCSWLIDRRAGKDFAFWGYLFGTLIFWGGLSLLTWNSECSWLLYFFINMAMMVSSIVFRRNVLMVFGAVGVFNFFCHLAYQVFENSVIFPFALSFIGLTIVALGILYQKHHFRILSWLSGGKTL